MKLTYRDVDWQDPGDCRLLAQWYNNPDIKYLYSLFPTKESASIEFTPKYFERMGQSLPSNSPYHNVIVSADETPIGQAVMEIDTPKILTKKANTAWLALVIGEPNYRQCGLGKLILEYLEKSAEASGALQIEIGVFEHNERALHFFRQLGYEPFERRQARTWYRDRLWDEIRMLKNLSA